MTCYFHQNLAYIAFKSAKQMHSVCSLRIFTDNDRLLTGRSRFQSQQDAFMISQNDSHITKRKAMSTHTHNLPDLRSYKQPSKRAHRNHRAYSPI